MSAPGKAEAEAADYLIQLASGRHSRTLQDERPQKKQRNSREELNSIILQLEDDPLIEVIEQCAVKPSSQEDTEHFYSLLRSYLLLKMGEIQGLDFQQIKQELGVEYLIDMILPEAEAAGAIKTLGTLLDKSSLEDECDKDPLILALLEELEGLLGAEQMSLRCDSYFDFCGDPEILGSSSFFEKLDMKTRLKWAFFISVSSYQLEANRGEGLTAKPGIWPKELSEEALRLVRRIDRRIVEMSPCPPPAESTKPYLLTQQESLRLPLVDLPGLPNWMPNGGDSCFISSTLWALSTVLHREISEMEPTGSADCCTSKARQAFCGIYSDLTSGTRQPISVAKVNALRRAVQEAFPDHFIEPDRFAQEDPYGFLVCLAQSLLELPSCSARAPKFEVLHSFTRSDDAPLVDSGSYDYATALEPAYSQEPTPIVNVRLDDRDTGPGFLKDLVTGVRQTEKLERNAYRKEGVEPGPKFRSLPVEHKEQLLVGSLEEAPEYFIGRLTRFRLDYATGMRSKRFDFVAPNASLDFNVKGEEEGRKVSYDLAAITVHSGRSINGGHYYTYLRKKMDGVWKFYKYDDTIGSMECEDAEQVVFDAAANGYLFYYKKREAGEDSPDLLPLEQQPLDTLSIRGTLSRPAPLRPLGPASSSALFAGGPLSLSGDCLLAEEETPGAGSWMPPPRLLSPIHEMASFGDYLNGGIKGDLSPSVFWVSQNLPQSFELTLDDPTYETLPRLFGNVFQSQYSNHVAGLELLPDDAQVIQTVANFMKRTIFFLDPQRDRDLQVVGGYPIPGDSYRFGEDFVEASTLYIIRNEDGTFAVIKYKKIEG